MICESNSPRQTTKWYDDFDQPSVRIEECSEGSLASNSASSGCGSLPRKDRPNIITGNKLKLQLNSYNFSAFTFRGRKKGNVYIWVCSFTCLIIDSPEVDMHLQSADNEGLKSHQRNDSYTSQHSRGSIGYNSLGHSRQSSVGSEKNPYATHTR